MGRLGWLVCGGVLGAGCFMAPGVDPTATTAIGSDGGSVKGPDGALLLIPPGSVGASVAVSLERASSGAPPLAVRGVGPVLAALPHGQRFSGPVTLSLPAPAGGVVVTAQPGGAWQVLPTRLQAGEALVVLEHFSFFAVVPQFAEVVFGDSNTVRAVRGDGTSLRTLFEGPAGQTFITGVAARADTGEVFFTDNGSDTVRALAEDGGLRTLHTSPDRSLNPTGVAVDAANDLLFWAEGGALKRAPLDGGGAVTLVPAGVSSVAVEPGAQLLYWTDQERDEVRRSAYDGSGTVTLHTQPDRSANPRGVAVDGAAGLLFWAEGSDLLRSDLDGGQVRVIATGPGRYPMAVAVDSLRQHVYWTDNGTDSVTRAAYDGSGALVLFTDPVATSNPDGIAVRP